MDAQKHPALTFGIVLSQTGSWPELAAVARRIEALGFDKLWIADHFVPPGVSQADWFDCWTTLAGLALETRAIRIGTLVSSMTLRNPAVLARMAMTVDHISGGRLELGVGAAGARACHTMTGVPIWGRRERSARFREFVEILDAMLGQDVTTYSGQYYQVEAAELYPRPVQQPHPPLNIAAHGPKSLRLVARHGDAWNSCFPGDNLTAAQSSEVTRQRLAMLADFAAEAGRDPAQIGRTYLFGWSTDKPFASLDALTDAVGRYHAIGIRDFVFMYLPASAPLPDAARARWQPQAIIGEELLERVALDVIPALRRSLARDAEPSQA